MSFAFLHARRQQNRQDAAKFGARFQHTYHGRRAFEAGLMPVDCPHVLDTPEQRAWIAGWFAGYDRWEREQHA